MLSHIKFPYLFKQIKCVYVTNKNPSFINITNIILNKTF